MKIYLGEEIKYIISKIRNKHKLKIKIRINGEDVSFCVEGALMNVKSEEFINFQYLEEKRD